MRQQFNDSAMRTLSSVEFFFYFSRKEWEISIQTHVVLKRRFFFLFCFFLITTIDARQNWLGYHFLGSMRAEIPDQLEMKTERLLTGSAREDEYWRQLSARPATRVTAAMRRSGLKPH